MQGTVVESRSNIDGGKSTSANGMSKQARDLIRLYTDRKRSKQVCHFLAAVPGSEADNALNVSS